MALIIQRVNTVFFDYSVINEELGEQTALGIIIPTIGTKGVDRRKVIDLLNFEVFHCEQVVLYCGPCRWKVG